MSRLPRLNKGVLLFIGLAALGFVVLLISHLISDDTEPFSSNSSPDKLLNAENFFIDGCAGECATGLIAIKRKDGEKVGEIELSSPTPDIFFYWVNNKNLRVLFSDAGDHPHIDLSKISNGLTVSVGTYHVLSASVASAKATQQPKYAVSDAAVSASYTSGAARDGELCELSMVANQAPELGKLGVEIEVHRDTCSYKKQGEAICGFMNSRFWVAGKPEGSSQLMLTSANIAGVSGYGVLPTGADHMAIRGQFLEGDANQIIDKLKGKSISVDYNFNFSELTMRYRLPLISLSRPIEKFLKCVDGADFEWSKHIQE
ncbi:GeBP family protein [Trinickia diaoshuihuensis]|uniref:GeBP family protein n=1 Tax=Trinickia diaoshuihuensis TaxID=2292265 RepID=UPI0013C2A45A|nr:GeBP family protein [Trinickia diaoshuihuensis]